MSIADLRDGLGANLGTVSGLRVALEIPDNPNPPIAVIQLENVLYNQAFANGLTQYNFTVTLLAGRASERIGQRNLDAYTSNGASSVKLAIESDKTLGGSAYDVRVTEMTNYGTVSLGEVTYLAADYSVAVYAD